MRVVAMLVLASCWTQTDATTTKPPQTECGAVADHIVQLMPDVHRRQLIATLRRGADVGKVEAAGSAGKIALPKLDDDEAKRVRETIANTDKIEVTLGTTSMRDVFVERCVTDQWPAAARQCLTTTESLWGRCATLLTATQRAAVIDRLDD